MTVDGAVAAYAPPYLSAPDLRERATAVATNAAEAWGAAPEALLGYALLFEQEPFTCGLTGDDAELVVGCTWQGQRVIQVLAFGAACPEATVIAHEVGHAVLGDDAHHDARWTDEAFWGGMLAVMRRTAPAACDLGAFIARNQVHEHDD